MEGRCIRLIMIVTAAAMVCLAILAVAGLDHLRHPDAFSAAIRAQRIWPERLVAPFAALVAAVEAGLGGAGVAIMVLSDAATVHAGLLGAVGLLYGCYALYGLYLLRTRPGVPCACSGDAGAIDRWVVGRATTLAILAVVAALYAPIANELSAVEAIVAASASVAYGLALWALPGALQDTAAVVAARSRRGA